MKPVDSVRLLIALLILLWGNGGGSVLTEPHIKERLSVAYVAAVAGSAGVSADFGRPQDYGVDGTFHPIVQRRGHFIESGFSVDFQLKATINWAFDQTDVVYDVDVRAFNNIVERDPSAVPLVLIVMCLPQQDTLWVRQNERALLVKNACYWYWAPNSAPSTNSATTRLRIPRSNVLTAVNLKRLLVGAEAYNKGEQDHV